MSGYAYVISGAEERGMIGRGAWVSVIFMMAMAAESRSSADNLVFDILVGAGVPVAADEKVVLPRPTLPDGLDSAGQRRQVQSAIEGKHSWDEYTRRAVVAPLVLRISDDSTSDRRIGRRLDLWFIAYGNLNLLRTDDFFTRQIGLASADIEADGHSHAKLLTDEQIAKRGLPRPISAADARFVAVQSTLLDRVQLSVTTRNMKSESGESVCIASLLDEHFAMDQEFPNTWRAITRDNAGRKQLGPPQVYVGMGSYVKATRLIEPEGALFIEYHLAFAEPKEWFQGTNLLRSKLPIVAQDAVRKFRRSLERQ